jgi:predicted kinase
VSAPSIQRPVTADSKFRRPLHRRALHVVLDAAHAAHLFAAARAARPAMHQRRQRRAVPGRRLRRTGLPISTRPLNGATPITTSRATFGSSVNTDDTSEPLPSLVSSIASSSES